MTPRDGVARLRVAHPDSERVAVVGAPGDRWFAIDVESGLSLDHFEEEASDSEVEQRLREYVEVAVAYVEGEGTVEMGRGGPRPIRVRHGENTFVLRRSVGGVLRSFLGAGRRRPLWD